MKRRELQWALGAWLVIWVLFGATTIGMVGDNYPVPLWQIASIIGGGGLILAIVLAPFVYLSLVSWPILRQPSVRAKPWPRKAALWYLWICLVATTLAIAVSAGFGVIGLYLLFYISFLLPPVLIAGMVVLGVAEAARLLVTKLGSR